MMSNYHSTKTHSLLAEYQSCNWQDAAAMLSQSNSRANCVLRRTQPTTNCKHQSTSWCQFITILQTHSVGKGLL